MALSPLLLAMSLATTPIETKCNPIPGWSEMLKETSPDFIVIGEMHGNWESPRIFADAVCLTAETKPVIVAVEQSASIQPAIDAFLASDGGEQAREKFLAAKLWQSEFKDGRSSEAMFELFERLRLMVQAGKVQKVVAFRPNYTSEDLTREDNEKAMAALILQAARQDVAVLVFTGNVHAMRTPVQWGGGYLPMAGHLPADRTITLDIMNNGGNTWACSGRPVQCGPMQIGKASNDWRRGVMLHDKADSPYSGGIYLGEPTTASPPQQ